MSLMLARRDAEQRAMDRAFAASQVVSTNASWIVELARQALRRIDDALGPDLSRNDSQAVRDIREAVQDLPGSVKAYVVDDAGNTILSTDLQVKPVNITDREYFSALAEGAPFYTSSLLISRLNGHQIFAFSRRLERQGKFAGAAIVSFEAELLRDIWSSLRLDETSTVSLIRNDGMLVARYPPAEGPLDMSGYVLFTDYLKHNSEGTYPAISPADGRARFVGYRRVPDAPLIAVASVSNMVAYAPFWRLAWVMLGLAIPGALVLTLGAFWIVRLLRRDAKRQIELQHALETNRLLFRDTHHRVKNNLQSVQSLVRMQNIPESAKTDLQARIAAMTAVHEHIYRLDKYIEVAAEQLIPDIVVPVIRTFASPVQVKYDIEPIIVDRDHATPLALLVNEVVTNALKYAYPDGTDGTIEISLRHQGGRSTLVISDDGVGFDTSAAHKGMGSRLIAGMVRQLDGTFSYTRDGGTKFQADIALSAKSPVSQAIH